MTTARRVHVLLFATVTIVAGYLVGARSAAASPASPNDGNGFGPPQIGSTPAPFTRVVTTGSPWWAFVLVAAAACAVTVLAVLLVIRLRHIRPADHRGRTERYV